MIKNPQIYHGEWWVPANLDPNLRGFCPDLEPSEGIERKYTGTLTYYGDEDSILELYRVPSELPHINYTVSPVIWGEDLDGNIFTLFSSSITNYESSKFAKIEYKVRYIIKGEHLLSWEDDIFSRCVVKFPYLRKWALQNNISFKQIDEQLAFLVDNISQKDYLSRSDVEEEEEWLLQGQVQERIQPPDVSLIQSTNFVIQAKRGISFKKIIRYIVEFEQFISIALYCEQSATEAELVCKSTEKKLSLLFKAGPSVDPGVRKLIKFEELKEKVPSMLKIWHDNYNNILPICHYLIQSTRKKSVFDVPDFIIIAQALDGYFKRFENKRNIKKYEEEIKYLLNLFKDVEVIQKCKIDTEVLKDSRHKYSHLYPDDEDSKAVSGSELLWLTKKGQVLLTCCILRMLGLTGEEINLCCKGSLVEEWVRNMPPEL